MKPPLLSNTCSQLEGSERLLGGEVRSWKSPVCFGAPSSWICRVLKAKSAPMSIKETLRKKSFELLSDPRVLKLMQNEQFMKAMSSVVQVPGKVNHFTDEQTERFAKMMNLARAQELKDLKRQVGRLEAELERLKQELANK